MGSSPQYTVFEVRPARHLCPRCRLPIAIRSSTGSRRKIGMARQAIDVGYHCNLVLYDAQLRQQHRLLYYYFSSWVHFFGESSQQPATWVHFFGESTSTQCFNNRLDTHTHTHNFRAAPLARLGSFHSTLGGKVTRSPAHGAVPGWALDTALATPGYWTRPVAPHPN